ncbi:MAG: response regulator [Anaerolineales bacterium]|nr:response regulator [Anaerolineales bacterium]
MNIDALTDFLDANNFRVAPIHSGLEFLECIPTVRPNIILMDIQMPGMDGFEAMRRLAHHHEDPASAVTPIIADCNSCYAAIDRCLDAGANAYMSKPMRLSDLLATIHNLLKA